MTTHKRMMMAELENEVDALRAELARLRAEARWIPTAERMPDLMEDCLIYYRERTIQALYCQPIRRERPVFTSHLEYDHIDPSDVTHWRPLPAPPKVTE